MRKLIALAFLLLPTMGWTIGVTPQAPANTIQGCGNAPCAPGPLTSLPTGIGLPPIAGPAVLCNSGTGMTAPVGCSQFPSVVVAQGTISGVVADYVSNTDGAISAASSSFTSASTTFASIDVGKTLVVMGAGPTSQLNSVTISSAGSGCVPGDVVTLAGGTSTTASTVKVNSCRVMSASIASAGTGGPSSATTLTVYGTTGSGFKFSAVVIVSGGGITTVNSINSNGGAYNVNPTTVTAEPVTCLSCGLTGATLNLTMGVLSAFPATLGSYSVVPNNPVSQGSSTGTESGVALTANWFNQLKTTITAVSGSTATLAATASNAVSGANWFYATDNSSALSVVNNGLPAFVYNIPEGLIYTSSTLLVSNGRTVTGTVAESNYHAVNGSTIICDHTVSPCVETLGSAGSSLSNLQVQHPIGQPIPTSVGIQVNAQFNTVLQNTTVRNSGICYQLLASNTHGISVFMNTTFATGCVDAFTDINSYAEVKINGGRWGGSGDYPANTFFRIEGGFTNTSEGPNTIYANGGLQLNTGNGTQVRHMIEFANLGAGGAQPTPGSSGIEALEYNFSDLHTEIVGECEVYSDSTWNIVNKLTIHHVTMPSQVPLYCLSTATSVYRNVIDGNDLDVSDITLAPNSSSEILGLQVTNNAMYIGGISLTSANSASTASVLNNSIAANLTLSGPWASLAASGNNYTGSGTAGLGSVSYTGTTGQVNVNDPQNPTSCAGWSLGFGGLNTGVTFSAQGCYYTIIGHWVHLQFGMALTSKGTATGAATFRLNNSFLSTDNTINAAGSNGGLGFCANFSGMASLTGPVQLQTTHGNSAWNFVMAGASGVSALTDANFTNTTVMQCALDYYK